MIKGIEYDPYGRSTIFTQALHDKRFKNDRQNDSFAMIKSSTVQFLLSDKLDIKGNIKGEVMTSWARGVCGQGKVREYYNAEINFIIDINGNIKITSLQM